MVKEPKNSGVDYSSYVVRRNLEDYWRAEEKVELIVIGLTGKIPVTTLCKINNVTPSQYYEWREKFLATGKQGLMANGGKTQREAELEKKISILERCIGELTLEKELLKKISEDS
ncbi:MAG: transposase [Oligoflexia bacterium]|nr:transposase [Oligoflexia bacterium]